MNNIKKLIRFILIYGIARTLFKVFGRLRINFIKLPSFKIKDVGLIGCGQFGFATIGFFISKKSKHTFIRAYDVDKKNQQSFENFYLIKKETASFMSIINDIEVNYVYIASNHFSHTEYALSAIKNNKIVYIEKPISVNYQQFKSLVNSIKKNNAEIYAGYNRPFSKAVLDLKKNINNFPNKPFSLSYFISGHLLESEHWYRDVQEGTRICGNVGHWLDLTVHILTWRKLPNSLNISISYSDLNEIDDNISITITTEYNDIISIMLTSRSEPFEGINETINIQYNNTIAKIDDFRKMIIWQDEKLIKKSYWPKDVGHYKAILQPFNTDKYKRNWSEVENSTLLMLFITDMVSNKEANKKFKFDKEWEELNK
jgi:predicted dehydrogenase